MIARDSLTCCLIIGVGFRGQLSDENTGEMKCLRVVAMATNFGTKIAITGFVRTIATRQLAMEGFEWSAN